MKFLRSRCFVSFMNKQQGEILLKDPLKDLKVSVEAFKIMAENKQIFQTRTGFIPESIHQRWMVEAASKGTQIILSEKAIDIPYNFEGIDKVPDTKYSYMFKSLVGTHKVQLDKLEDHLTKIYRGVLYSMAVNDEEFLYEYTEKRFADRLRESLAQCSAKGDQILAVEDFGANQGEPIPYKCYQVQGAMIKGLNTDRSKNLSEQEYHIWRDIDPFGLDVYTPIGVTNPDNFIDRKQSDHLYDDFKLVLLRLLVRIQSPLRIKVLKSNGLVISMHLFKHQEVFVNSNDYSYNHLAVFESQLLEPPSKHGWQHMGLMLWLQHFKLSTWKLVDIDNWMEGNPLIIKGSSRGSYKDEIFSGSPFDGRCLIDVRNV